ncbi:MAG: guanine deaminase [Neisseriales bacterium]|nr:MAG: guanine deaminase [Neisseriales bacterium]
MKEQSVAQAVRGSLLDFIKPVQTAQQLASQFRYIEDGLLILIDGKINWSGSWETGQFLLPENCSVTHYPNKWILPGFIDTHIHFPQMEMVGAYGEQLLEWLNRYTFPTEMRYADQAYATTMASVFIKELLRHGTTTALALCTVHPESVDALFQAADAINMRMIAGKVMMDRNAPAALLDTPEDSYTDSEQLIKKWHKYHRLLYAITPRFAPTSTDKQLALAGQLKQAYPDTYVHTHLCENLDEIKWVQSLFPKHKNYLDVYHSYGLTGSHSVFAHGVHLNEDEWDCLAQTDSTIAFCPTSNLYLGSGLFCHSKAQEKQVRVGLGTDIGAGTSMCQLQTLNEAYKVTQLQHYSFSALEAFYMITIGGAKALSLDHLIGNFDMGKEADFVVIDPIATPLQKLRYHRSSSLIEKLFALIVLGDDRSIYRTYVNGDMAFAREEFR